MCPEHTTTNIKTTQHMTPTNDYYLEIAEDKRLSQTSEEIHSELNYDKTELDWTILLNEWATAFA